MLAALTGLAKKLAIAAGRAAADTLERREPPGEGGR
jgi:hypothetical protein